MVHIYYKNFSINHLLFFVFILCGSTFAPLIVLARPIFYPSIINLWNFDMSWYLSRYSLFAPILGFMLWIFVWQYYKPKVIKRYILIILLVITLTTSYYRFPLLAYGYNQDWIKKSNLIKSCLKTGCPKNVIISIYPEGWIMPIESKKISNCP